MNKILIDTDILIEVLRGNQKIIFYLETLSKQGKAFFYSPITKAEIFHGLREEEVSKTELLFKSMECVPITDEIGKKAGLYLKIFHRSFNLQLGDSLIAATAYYNNAVLLTRNRKHCPMEDIEVLIV